jgi:hypothetical protein
MTFLDFTAGCKSDSECRFDEKCHNRQCINPCYIQNPCHPTTAECFATNHRAECRCKPGLEGNPLVRCETVGCKSDNECPAHLACINRQCVDPCLHSNPCAANAICFVQNHRPFCRCPPGLEGNPNEYCTRPVIEAEPECRLDPDCPAGLACINERCQNPCVVLNPCHPTARCRVLNTSPVRTMICECPPGTYGDGYNQCG